VFFSVHNQASGSIIDFIKKRQGGTIGTARKQLRPWISQIDHYLYGVPKREL
jgi:hypothetical protein